MLMILTAAEDPIDLSDMRLLAADVAVFEGQMGVMLRSVRIMTAVAVSTLLFCLACSESCPTLI